MNRFSWNVSQSHDMQLSTKGSGDSQTALKKMGFLASRDGYDARHRYGTAREKDEQCGILCFFPFYVLEKEVRWALREFGTAVGE